jgi:LysM repeat protein
MSDKESAQNVIDSYRRRQQAARKAPIVIGLAVLFVIVGIVILSIYLMGSGKPSFSISLFASDTPTPTNTATATATFTSTPKPTITPTGTAVPTETVTPTQSGPFIYQVTEGDTLYDIAQKYQVDLLLLITVNNLDPTNPTIRVGDKLTIPGPDTKLPSPTALPTGIRKGTKINYQVQVGDSLLSIAIQFNSTVEDIKKENKLTNENQIFVAQSLVIPVNMVTPVPTITQTATSQPGAPQATKAPPATKPVATATK